MVVLECSHLVVCNLDQCIVLCPQCLDYKCMVVYMQLAPPLLDCRTCLDMFHGTLFQNMEDLLSFIQYSHSTCLKLNAWKKRSILQLGSDTTCSRVVLSEVLVFSYMNVAVLYDMQLCALGL